MKDESVSGQNTGVVCLHWLSATVTAFVLYLCMCVCMRVRVWCVLQKV